MLRKAIIMTIELGAEAAPLSASRLVASFDLVAPADNNAPITISSPTGEAEMAPGSAHSFYGVDLAEITAEGTEGDKLAVIGNTTFNA